MSQQSVEDASSVRLQISSRLMESYRSVTPAVAGEAVTVVETGAGAIVAGIDTTGMGYVIQRTSGGTSGWSSLSLGTELVTAPIAAVVDAAGVAHVFASSGNQLLHAEQTSPGATTWTAWTAVPGVQAATQISTLNQAGATHVAVLSGGSVSYGVALPGAGSVFQWSPNVITVAPPSAGITNECIQLLPYRDGQVLIGAYWQPGGPQTTFMAYANTEGTWDSLPLQPDNAMLPPLPYSGQVMGDEVALSTAFFTGLAIWDQPTSGAAWSLLYPDNFVAMPWALVGFRPWLGTDGLLNGLAVTADTSATPWGPGQLYYIQASASPLSSAQWTVTSLANKEAAVIPSGPTSTYLSETAFAVRPDPATGQMRGFVIDIDGNLCLIEQTPTGWTPLTPMGHKASAFWLVDNPGGYAEVVALGDDGLFIISHTADDGEWARTKIELALPDQAKAYNCYGTDISITDANGVPLPGAIGQITASGAVEAVINGVAVKLGPVAAASFQANALGKVMIETPISSINAPELKIHVVGMVLDSWVSVVPQLEVNRTIAGAASSGASLLAQKDRNGNYVVNGPVRSDPTQADHIARSLSRCTEMAQTAGLHLSGHAGPLVGNLQPDRVRYIPPGETRSGRHLDLAAVPPGSWQIDFSQGFAQFRELSDAEAAEIIGPVELFGISIGDVLDAVRHGVSQLVTITIQTVVDPVKKVVTAINAQVVALVEQAQQTFTATIKMVEHVYDVVEGIFAQLEAYFEELIQWLAFFFAWQDILLTKHALKYLVDQALAVLQGVFNDQEAVLAGLLTTASQSIDAWIQSSASAIGNIAVSTAQSANPIPDFFQHGSAHNIVQSALTGFLSALSATDTAAVPRIAPEIDAALSSANDILEQLSQQLSAQPGFQQAQANVTDFIATLASNPDALITTSLASLTSGLTAIGADGVSALAGVINQLIAPMLSAYEQFLNSLTGEADIPVIGPLYKLIAGEPLTYIDLVCLSAAVAITVSYKLATQEAPFTEASLATFKQNWSAQALLGLMRGERRPPAPATVGDPNPYIQGRLMLLGGTALSGFIAAIADFEAMCETPGLLSSICVAIVDTCNLILNYPWANYLSPNPPGNPGTNTADGLTSLNWVMDGVQLCMDAICIASKLRHRINFEKWGPPVTTVVGLTHLGLLAGAIAYKAKNGSWDPAAQINDVGGIIIYLPDMSSLLILAGRKDSLPAKTAQTTINILAPLVGGIMIFSNIPSPPSAH